MGQPLRWRAIVPSKTQLIMWGGGDQARVNKPILDAMGCRIIAVVDDTSGLLSPFSGIPIFHGWDKLAPWLEGQQAATLGFVIAIGNPHGRVRCRLHDKLVSADLKPVSFADPTALICSSAVIGEGFQAMPMAIVHNDAVIGRQCLINTRALVEHDCVLEEGVEIGPGAVLCGRVHLAENVWIGAGATVLPRVTIGRDTIVGAGAVVVSDLPSGVVAMGIPARPVNDRDSQDIMGNWRREVGT